MADGITHVDLEDEEMLESNAPDGTMEVSEGLPQEPNETTLKNLQYNFPNEYTEQQILESLERYQSHQSARSLHKHNVEGERNRHFRIASSPYDPLPDQTYETQHAPWIPRHDKLKTTICRKWYGRVDETGIYAGGYCKFGDRCDFAHGAHELRRFSVIHYWVDTNGVRQWSASISGSPPCNHWLNGKACPSGVMC
jgi:hypothetical protein